MASFPNLLSIPDSFMMHELLNCPGELPNVDYRVMDGRASMGSNYVQHPRFIDSLESS